MLVIVTRYAQRNKDTILCKRNVFKRGKLVSIDSNPVSEQQLSELVKGMGPIYIVNVEKKTDLDLKSF